MPFPPIKKTMEGLLENFSWRLTLVERRLAISSGGGGWAAVDASETVKGIAELADPTEALAGVDHTRIITPFTLRAGLDTIPTVPQATTAVSGKVELATQTEVTTGTDSTRAVTPSTLRGKQDPAFAASGLNGTAQSIANSTWTLVSSALGTPDINRGFTSWSGGALTIAQSGIYLIGVSSFLLSTPTVHNIRATLNSTSPSTDSVMVAGTNAATVNEAASGVAALSAGDIIRFYVYQTSGAANTIRNLPQTSMSVVRLTGP
jgi:hypothetical protein